MSETSPIATLAAWSRESREVMMPLPASAYTSTDILELEIENLFYRKWICAGHLSELQHTGDYLTLDIIDKPVLIVRDETNQIRAFSNVCRHRSSVLATGSGTCNTFTCPYHAWTYDLNGRLRGAPYMEAEQIKGVRLPEYRVEIWQGLVFVSLAENPDPLTPQLAKLEPNIEPYDHSNYQVVYREVLEFSCNWKVLVENFCESYHLFCVHKTTLEPDSPTRTIRVSDGGDAFNHHMMFNNTEHIRAIRLKNLPQALQDTGQLVCVYPCLTFSIDPTVSIWLSVLPTCAQTLRCTAQIAMHTDEGSEIDEADADAVRESTRNFMAEDKRIIERVQRGLAADAGNAGLLHPWEQTNWEFGHYLARELLSFGK